MMFGVGDNNPNDLSAVAGSSVIPNCIAGQSPMMLEDGSYVCRAEINAMTLGVNAPNCGQHSAAVLSANGSWTCESLGQTGLSFTTIALIAAAGWWLWRGKRKSRSQAQTMSMEQAL